MFIFMGSSQALYQAGVGVKGTDVPTWISIMSERSVPHLQKGTCLLLVGTGTQVLIFVICNQYKLNVLSLLVFERYKSYSPYDMQESIMKEVKGDLQKSFLVIGEHLSAVLMKFLILK